MHSDLSSFPTHALLAGYRASSRLGYPVLGGDCDHAGDVCADDYDTAGDSHLTTSLNPNRKTIPRLMIHRISEAYGRYSRL